MNHLKVSNVQYRSFHRKIAFYAISCELHFEKRYCQCDDIEDCSKIELNSNKCDWRQRMRSNPCDKFEPIMTFDLFKKNFQKRNFQNFSSIFIRFLFSCECEKYYEYLHELSNLLEEKDDLRYATKVVCLIFVKHGSFWFGPFEFLNATQEQAVKQLLNVNNLVVIIHEFPYWKRFDRIEITSWFYKLRNRMFRYALQEAIPTIIVRPFLANLNWITKTNAGLYADSINPALGIIINHLTFPEEQLLRKGSLKDVETLSAIFREKNIPHIVIQDARMEHDNAIFDMLKNEQFHDLKDVYIFLMSHGKENDVILSGSGQYSLYERLNNIMKNTSLKDKNKIFFVIACRGRINPAYESFVPEKITNETTDASALDEKTVVIHSAPKHHTSPRTEDGAVFVQHVRNVFGKHFDELSVDELVNQMDENLKNCYYYSLYDNKRFDYVKKEETSISITTTSKSFSDITCFNLGVCSNSGEEEDEYVTRGEKIYPQEIQETIKKQRAKQKQNKILDIELELCAENF